MAKIAVGTGTPAEQPLRQLAGIILKGYVNTHWDPSQDNFVGPQTTANDKALIRQLLPPGLASPDSKIRTAVVRVK